MKEMTGEQMSNDLDALRTGLRPMLYPRVPVRIHQRLRRRRRVGWGS